MRETARRSLMILLITVLLASLFVPVRGERFVAMPGTLGTPNDGTKWNFQNHIIAIRPKTY